jgi:hypothetical protein
MEVVRTSFVQCPSLKMLVADLIPLVTPISFRTIVYPSHIAVWRGRWTGCPAGEWWLGIGVCIATRSRA